MKEKQKLNFHKIYLKIQTKSKYIYIHIYTDLIKIDYLKYKYVQPTQCCLKQNQSYLVCLSLIV